MPCQKDKKDQRTQALSAQVSEKKLQATVTASGTDASKSYVHFHAASSSTKEASASLSQAYTMLSSTAWSMSSLDSRISSSKEFLTKAYNAASRMGPGGQGPGGPGGMDPMLGFGGEEDLMGGGGGGSHGVDIWEE